MRLIICLLFTIVTFGQETFDKKIIDQEKREWVLLWSYEVVRNGKVYEEQYYIRREEMHLAEPQGLHILCPKEEENDYRSI